MTVLLYNAARHFFVVVRELEEHRPAAIDGGDKIWAVQVLFDRIDLWDLCTS